MRSDDRSKISKSWDAEYNKGRYVNEQPIQFVNKILETLNKYPSFLRGCGLYVGCGNGRNYLPLVEAGLDLFGLDISKVAISKLSSRLPVETKKLIQVDFLKFNIDRLFDYIIAIQVFQHGSQTDVDSYFKQVDKLFAPGGFLFLRVNSTSTQIYFRHKIIESNKEGGFTVQYNEGHKKDLTVHFFSYKELLKLTKNKFSLLSRPHEDVIQRQLPKRGYWAQWELILKKK